MINNDDIQFDEFKIKPKAVLNQPQTSGMVRFLISKGIVKNEKQANYLLMAVTILFFISSIYIFITYVFDISILNKKSKLSPEQVRINKERLQQMMKNNNTITQ